jgi:hypothetical protein
VLALERRAEHSRADEVGQATEAEAEGRPGGFTGFGLGCARGYARGDHQTEDQRQKNRSYCQAQRRRRLVRGGSRRDRGGVDSWWIMARATAPASICRVRT